MVISCYSIIHNEKMKNSLLVDSSISWKCQTGFHFIHVNGKSLSNRCFVIKFSRNEHIRLMNNILERIFFVSRGRTVINQATISCVFYSKLPNISACISETRAGRLIFLVLYEIVAYLIYFLSRFCEHFKYQ